MKMKLRGGYNILLAGKPTREVQVLPEPQVLYLPLQTRRFSFSELSVAEGQRVKPGQVLAKDPGNYSVPLLAPRAGTVKLNAAENRLVLENVAHPEEEPYDPRQDHEHVPRDMGSVGMKRYKLLALGAWQFFHDAHTEELPEPFGTPRAVIVSTLRLEPFCLRGDVQLHKRLASFTRGMEHLQSLLEYQPIYLVLPDIKSEFAKQVRDAIRGYAWAKLIQVPLRYGYDNFAVLARALGYKREAGRPVWALRTEGVLGLDRALTLSRACTVRIVSLGGPAVESPVHLKAVPGYPIKSILKNRICDDPVRVINGGALTGEQVDQDQVGLDPECVGLTVLREQTDRELFGFVRPGWSRRSYSKCFLSCLRGAFPERFTTGLRGEGRPCIACGFCEEVCPAGIMPHLLHKLFYQDEPEELERTRLDLCVECGLCSFVCPSKIELRGQFLEAKELVRRELHPAPQTDALESASPGEEVEV